MKKNPEIQNTGGASTSYQSCGGKNIEIMTVKIDKEMGICLKNKLRIKMEKGKGRGKKGRKEGGREGGKEGRREGGREGGKERRREGGKEGRREEGYMEGIKIPWKLTCKNLSLATKSLT